MAISRKRRKRDKRSRLLRGLRPSKYATNRSKATFLANGVMKRKEERERLAKGRWSDARGEYYRKEVKRTDG